MNKLKKSFSDWRNSTPKRVQWLLMAVAFVLVIILLTLLLMGRKEESVEPVDDTPIKLMFYPDNMTINWADVIVGDKKHQTIKILANKPIKILNVKLDKDIAGLTMDSGCADFGIIDTEMSCTVNLNYVPTVETDVQPVSIDIQWHNADKPNSMSNITKYSIILGAENPPVTNPISVPEPPIQKPDPIPTPPSQDSGNVRIDPPVIAPPPFETPTPIDPEPSEACSDFSFPGYDNAGNQIGWIKPRGGAYYFHPFSDTTCEDPTGVYNPDNGIITDINNTSKKIGTDADHIGYAVVSNGTIPQLTSLAARNTTDNMDTGNNTSTERRDIKMGRLKMTSADAEQSGNNNSWQAMGGFRNASVEVIRGTTAPEGQFVVASQPYDRSFVLRQYKPIPATIVSEVRADADVYQNGKPLPVRATVDRNVYSDDGRNIIIPTGTMMLGYVTGELPGPYKSIGRMQISWYQFIRPDGVEFNFTNVEKHPFAGDAQGRVGVPGRGSSDYLEQFFMPMLTAIVPAAVNLIAPVTDAFVNQIDLDNNTVVQSGTVRSSELAKNEIITTWNQVAQKLLVDMMDNTVPPFTIAAGTRITVYAPQDLIVVCTDKTKKCYVETYEKASKASKRFDYTDKQNLLEIDKTGPDWVGQVRSFKIDMCCDKGKVKKELEGECKSYDYRTLVFYCQSSQYQAINNAKQDALYKNQTEQFKKQTGGTAPYAEDGTYQGTQQYNEQVLGLEYDANGAIKNPFETEEEVTIDTSTTVLTCADGSLPDDNGCCAGEIYTDMGTKGFNCCPTTGGDCFPPIL